MGNTTQVLKNLNYNILFSVFVSVVTELIMKEKLTTETCPTSKPSPDLSSGDSLLGDCSSSSARSSMQSSSAGPASSMTSPVESSTSKAGLSLTFSLSLPTFLQVVATKLTFYKISWLLLTFQLIHYYSKWLIHELIQHVWLSIRLNNVIARKKTNWTNWTKNNLILFLLPTMVDGWSKKSMQIQVAMSPLQT